MRKLLLRHLLLRRPEMQLKMLEKIKLRKPERKGEEREESED